MLTSVHGLLVATGGGAAVQQEGAVVSAAEGDNVTLRCEPHSDVVMHFSWYRQRAGRPPRLLASVYKHQQPAAPEGQQLPEWPRFWVLRGDRGLNHLHIRDVRCGDAAAYYCGSGHSNVVEFGDGVLLHVRGRALPSVSLHMSAVIKATKRYRDLSSDLLEREYIEMFQDQPQQPPGEKGRRAQFLVRPLLPVPGSPAHDCPRGGRSLKKTFCGPTGWPTARTVGTRRGGLTNMAAEQIEGGWCSCPSQDAVASGVRVIGASVLRKFSVAGGRGETVRLSPGLCFGVF
ncbi:hypothetical protein CRUP_035851 [Coryphaenoides rupestris]|nr:hypothetical protein CRUP_035851 [Coryphaenoides rupestris]